MTGPLLRSLPTWPARARGAERPVHHHPRCVRVPAEHRRAGAAMDSLRQSFTQTPLRWRCFRRQAQESEVPAATSTRSTHQSGAPDLFLARCNRSHSASRSRRGERRQPRSAQESPDRSSPRSNQATCLRQTSRMTPDTRAKLTRFMTSVQTGHRRYRTLSSGPAGPLDTARQDPDKRWLRLRADCSTRRHANHSVAL